MHFNGYSHALYIDANVSDDRRAAMNHEPNEKQKTSLRITSYTVCRHAYGNGSKLNKFHGPRNAFVVSPVVLLLFINICREFTSIEIDRIVFASGDAWFMSTLGDYVIHNFNEICIALCTQSGLFKKGIFSKLKKVSF